MVYFQQRYVACRTGEMLAISALSRLDMTNQPEIEDDIYLSLFLRFSSHLIERFRLNYGAIMERGYRDTQYKIHFKGNNIIYEAILHYLQIVDQPGIESEMLKHRNQHLLAKDTITVRYGR